MRAEVITGYDRIERDDTNELNELPHEYPFCLNKVIEEPTDGSERRVATFVELEDLNNRESRLFIERSPPEMNLIEEVFELIRETGMRCIVSGGLHEIRIDCEDKIKLLDDEHALIDHRENKVCFDDESYGNTMALEDWKVRERRIENSQCIEQILFHTLMR